MPWLAAGDLTAFAIRTIGRAADLGARESAIAALRNALPQVAASHHRSDIETELSRLGAAARSPRRPKRVIPVGNAIELDDLVRDRVYRRRALHEAGLGGSWQSGISHPAGGDYVLLFSDASSREEYGYKDQWAGDEYRYFGKWEGSGDMNMTGANQAVRDRSPNLHLFIAVTGGHRYEGRFECVGHELERTEREGASYTAIVFRLQRVADQR